MLQALDLTLSLSLQQVLRLQAQATGRPQQSKLELKALDNF